MFYIHFSNLNEFCRLGYEHLAMKFTTTLNLQSQNIVTLVEDAILSPQRKNAFLKLIEKRIKEFTNDCY